MLDVEEEEGGTPLPRVGKELELEIKRPENEKDGKGEERTESRTEERSKQRREQNGSKEDEEGSVG